MKTHEIFVDKIYLNKKGDERKVLSIVKKNTNIVAPETWPVSQCDVIFMALDLIRERQRVALLYFAKWAARQT